MRETAAELKVLQELIDRSHKRIGPHMEGITYPSKDSLTAKQVVKLLGGMKTVEFLINAHGPAVLEALLRRARSAHAKQMSAATPRDYGGSAFDWSDEGVYVRLDADRFFTYSRTPTEFPT